MTGYIDESLVPKIENVYIIGKSTTILLDTVLDTGFNDEFILPQKYFQDCELEFLGKEKYILANGTLVEEDVYLGDLIIDNKHVKAFISLTEDEEALLGTRLLDDKIVILNFKDHSIKIND